VLLPIFDQVLSDICCSDNFVCKLFNLFIAFIVGLLYLCTNVCCRW